MLYVLLLDFATTSSLFPTQILTAASRSPWSALLKYLDNNITFRSYLTFPRFTAGIETSSLPSLRDASHIFCFSQIQNENTSLNIYLNNNSEMAVVPVPPTSRSCLNCNRYFCFLFRVVLILCLKLVLSSTRDCSELPIS